MATKNLKKTTQINFKLDSELTTMMNELKKYYKISSNNEMVRYCLTTVHRIMLREKRELGLDIST